MIRGVLSSELISMNEDSMALHASLFDGQSVETDITAPL
jgi:hypothetical protein